MRTRWPVHVDAITALLGMLVAAGVIWWILAAANAVR